MAKIVKLSFASVFVGFLFVMFVMSAFQMGAVDAQECIGELKVVGECIDCAAQCAGAELPGLLKGSLCFIQAGKSVCGCCLDHLNRGN